MNDVELHIALEALKNDINQLNQRAKDARKQGKDTFIAQLMTASLPAKVQMALATQSLEDIEKAKTLIQQAEAELSLVESQKVAYFRQDSLNEIMLLAEEINELLVLHLSEKAEEKYAHLSDLYTRLPDDLKPKVFNSCAAIFQQFHGGDAQ